jgi:cytochrome c
MRKWFGMGLMGMTLAAGAVEGAEGLNLMVYSRTAGFRHGGAIDAGIEVLRTMAEAEGWELTVTEDAGAFTEENVARYDVIVFNNTTQNVLPEAGQREALQAFIRGGGGFVGIHAATDTLYDWEWYGQLVGAYFRGHPPGMQLATVKVEDPDHPSMQGMGDSFEFHDEWYFWRANPRENVQVLATLDRSSHEALSAYDADAAGDHPIIWTNEFDGGRVWYTALGHERGPVTDERFVKMLRNGILWAADQ